jgi:hypothetical protein
VSALVRLYPAAWRERYEEEFLDLLEARPPTVGDRFDIVRGAIDARRHPQVRRPEAPETTPDGPSHADWLVARRLGIGAVVGSVVWVLAWWVASIGPLVNDGGSSYRDGSAAFPLILLAILLLCGGLVGHLIRLPRAAYVARIGASVTIIFAFMWSFAPWVMPIGLVALLGLLVFALGALATPDWPILATVAVVVGCLSFVVFGIVSAGLVDLGGQVPYEVLLLVAATSTPIWLGIGASLMRRPANVSTPAT